MSDTPDTDGLYNSLLAENPGNYIYLEVMLQHTRELERERNELTGVIKSMRKNAKEDADRIEKLEQALSYGGGGKTLLSKFLNAVKERDQFRESAKLLVR
jgi:5'-deoxynucleotidase YfbR-like HD superfamily hydrolase